MAAQIKAQRRKHFLTNHKISVIPAHGETLEFEPKCLDQGQASNLDAWLVVQGTVSKELMLDSNMCNVFAVDVYSELFSDYDARGGTQFCKLNNVQLNT